jgi:protein-L-isoaspartate(D-aspartate) O-methyltransferase
LVVGAGTCYLATLLAYHARHVIAVEISPELVAIGAENLQREGVKNVTLVLGDGTKGWPSTAPYDAIVVTGSMPVLPEEFLSQLKIGGRLFVTLGIAPVMTATLFTQQVQGELIATPLFETNIAPLDGIAPLSRFTF